MTLEQLQRPKRASGRTRRLIQRAIELNAEGKAVYVIAKQFQEIQRVIDNQVPDSGIRCRPFLPVGWNWREMRVAGSDPNCVWLVDPYVIESDPTFIQMFNAMTAFD